MTIFIAFVIINAFRQIHYMYLRASEAVIKHQRMFIAYEMLNGRLTVVLVMLFIIFFFVPLQIRVQQAREALSQPPNILTRLLIILC